MKKSTYLKFSFIFYYFVDSYFHFCIFCWYINYVWHATEKKQNDDVEITTKIATTLNNDQEDDLTKKQESSGNKAFRGGIKRKSMSRKFTDMNKQKSDDAKYNSKTRINSNNGFVNLTEKSKQNSEANSWANCRFC